jgi:sulfate adenylyltransferase subunit 1
MDEKPLQSKGKYIIKHTSKEVRCMVKNIQYKIDINTLHRIENEITIAANDIGRISIRTTQPLLFDNYSTNRITGSVIIIDEGTNNTVGAGMII